jgi:hypothetical protein
MSIRFFASNYANAVVLAALCMASAAGQAPSSKPVATPLPRTPDGRPSLEGIWTNNTLTPLERPAELKDTPVLTDQAAAAYEKRVVVQRNRDQRDANAEVDVGRAYNELFYDQGTRLARIGGTIRSSIIVDPADGRIPSLTPEAQKRVAAAREHARLHPADRAQDRSLTERCMFWPTAGPPMLPGPYNNTYQIYQTPGYVAILTEMIHETRIIPLDGRPHLAPGVRKWTGDSRGRWEGDTLVIDTTNFTDKTAYRGSDENLHLTERLTRVSAETIVYKFTVDDPTAFTKPWTGEIPFTATSGPIYEYACHEGNYAMVDMLSGARAEERNEARKPPK